MTLPQDEALNPTGLQCLATVALHHGIEIDPQHLVREYDLSSTPDAARLCAMAEQLGLKARVVAWEQGGLGEHGQDGGLQDLAPLLPVMVSLTNGNWVILSAILQDAQGLRVKVVDPLATPSGVLDLDEASFLAAASGELLLIKRAYALTDPDHPFGLRWFIPEMLRYRRYFGEIAALSLALNGLALAVPVFFQIIIDKVLVHRTYSTLEVMGAGVTLALLFEAVLGYLRGYLLLHTTTKLDIRLARRTFERLMALPAGFFERNTAGVIAKHMQQASNLREFLTGRLFMTLLDASVLVIFLPVLLFYSSMLTALVLGCTLLICAVIGGIIGPYRRRLEQLYAADGARQALLVETLHGMQTVKALALEGRQRRIWDNHAAQAVERRFAVSAIVVGVRQLSGLIEKLMSVAIVWVGALLVFRGHLSVGALVAFQMLAGRVSSPLVQLVSLIHEYQDAALSVRMLGQVMNIRPERNMGQGLRPDLQGAISLRDLRFTYPDAPTPALAGLTLDIPPCALVGIVGASGSGKTTLTRLLQTLHPVQSGILRFDGHDVRELDVQHIRRQIGVVLQEAFLFRGTIRENIAAGQSDATMAQIIQAARDAGAAEFIEALPQTYDTVLEEGAANLSGGQRQRLSLARALLRQPPILILDEATSALDPDTEQIVVANLRRYARERTTIVVSHRLSTIRDADMLLVLDKGHLVGSGRHGELLANCPVYAHLWRHQQGG